MMTAAAAAAQKRAEKPKKRAERASDADLGIGTVPLCPPPLDKGPAGLLFLEVPRVPPQGHSIYPSGESFATIAGSAAELKREAALLAASASRWDRLLGARVEERMIELEETRKRHEKKAQQMRNLGAVPHSFALPVGDQYGRTRGASKVSYAEKDDDTEEEG